MSSLDERISAIKNNYNSIGLEEMDGVKLLNRMDTKYTFRAGLLPVILEEMKKGYYILAIGEKRCTHYETLYFDTPGYYMYLQHHNGKLNRFKVRMRQYVDTGLNYFEIKKKNNKKRTIKTRIKRSEFSESIEGKSSELLQNVASLGSDDLQPSLWVYFTRMTFVSHKLNERLTIDTGLTYRIGEKTLSYPNIVIAEVKQERSSKSMFISIMMHHHIQRVSMSKYCLGIASLVDNVKKNNFKVRLNIINKINNDAS